MRFQQFMKKSDQMIDADAASVTLSSLKKELKNLNDQIKYSEEQIKEAGKNEKDKWAIKEYQTGIDNAKKRIQKVEQQIRDNQKLNEADDTAEIKSVMEKYAPEVSRVAKQVKDILVGIGFKNATINEPVYAGYGNYILLQSVSLNASDGSTYSVRVKVLLPSSKEEKYSDFGISTHKWDGDLVYFTYREKSFPSKAKLQAKMKEYYSRKDAQPNPAREKESA